MVQYAFLPTALVSLLGDPMPISMTCNQAEVALNVKYYF